MRSFLAALRSLVLPYGATGGARIIIDGTAGTITGYDAQGKQSFTLTPSNFEIDSGSQLQMNGTNYTFIADGYVFQGEGAIPSVHGHWDLNVGSATNGPYFHLLDLATRNGGTIELDPATGQLITDSYLRHGSILPGVAEKYTGFTYQNGWADLGGSYQLGGFKHTNEGRVMLRGWVIGGTKTDGTVIATLPSGYRPTKDEGLSVCNGTSGGVLPEVRVRASTGNIEIWGMSASTNGTCCLTGLSFDTFD